MKQIVYIFFLTFLIIGCSIKKKPEFIKVGNLKLVSFKNDTVKFTASAFFKNPNAIGGKIATEGIKVFVNAKEVARVSSKEFKVPANKEFVVPLKVAMPTKKILDGSSNNFLGSLLNSVIGNSVKIHFKGNIKYKVLGFSSTYPIDKVEEFKIKL